MSRGGRRDNAGRKSGWLNRETCLLRVPTVIAEDLMKIAHNLDRERFLENETKSKIVDIPPIIEGMPTEAVPIDEAMGQLQLLTVQPEIKSTQNIKSLSQSALGKRLGVHDTSVAKFRKNKTQADFAVWSSSKDPEGTAWVYNKEFKRYEMVSDLVTESENLYSFH